MNRNGRNPLLNCFAVLIALLFLYSPVRAQLTADFIVDKSGGCSPLTTIFTNTTRGASNNATWYWNFDNANGSINRNASATFVQEKTYKVTLTVTDAGRTSTKSMDIVVSRKPKADFTVSAPSGCINFTPQFTSTATTEDGTLTSFVWEYGDGSTDRVSTPVVSHTYTTPVIPTVVFTAINNYGCAATVVKSPLEVLPALTAGFTADKNILCTINDAAAFTNTSTGPSTLSYLWNFGDNKTATTRNVSHVYDQAGEYTVTLTTKNDKGCSHTYTLPTKINVAAYKLDVTVPSLLCSATSMHSFRATPYPVTYATIQWNFSDNPNSPNYGEYVSRGTMPAGDYSVKVKTTFGTCPVEINKTFKVFQSPVLPDFEAVLPDCGAPVTAQYKDLSTWAQKWEWQFRSNDYPYPSTSDNVKAPSKTYTADGSYTASLTATDANGCTASASKQQTVTRQTVTIQPFNSTATSGNTSVTSCAAFTSSFKANISFGSITAYQWNFSQGTTATTAEPAATFTALGSYPVSLSYKTDLNCTVTTGITAVVRSGPSVNFTGTTSICGNLQANFARTTTANVNDRHYWTIYNRNGTPVYYSYESSSTSFYNNFSDTGLYSIKLEVQNNNSSIYCSNQITKSDFIQVLPPFKASSINVVNNCDDGKRGELTFTENSRYAEKWVWDFGDGETATYTKADVPAAVKHIYKQTGFYKATLTVSAGAGPTACSFSTTKDVTVLLDTVMRFTGPPEVCGRYYAQFANAGSTVVDEYIWNFRHMNITGYANTSISYPGTASSTNFPDTGHYEGRIVLRVNNCFYEGSWQKNKIHVLPPYPHSLTATATCEQNREIVSFKDSTRGTEKWVWDFGDGTTATYTKANKPAIVKHAYKASGGYNIKVAISNAACSDEITAAVTILLKQKPTLSAVQTAVCVDKDLDITLSGFEVNPRNYSSYISHYGFQKLEYEDFTPFTGFNRNTVNPNDQDWSRRGIWQTVYTGSLNGLSKAKEKIRAITMPYGFPEYANCPDTSNFVTMRIDGPTTVLNVLKTDVCNKEEVVLEDKSTVPAGNSIVNRRWSFGDGYTQASPDANNPVKHLYTNVGPYNVSLTVTDNMGCSNTETKTVSMAGPKAGFFISPTPATNKNTVYVYNNSVPMIATTEYKWSFSYDGLKTTNANPAQRTYPRGGPATDTVTLIAHNRTSGCADTLQQLLPVINVNNAFTMNSSFLDGGCLPVLVRFQNISYNYYRFKWDFGDGTTLDDPTGTIRAPGHIYQQPGTYKVILYGEGAGSSKDTTIDSVIIKPLAFAGNVQSSVLEACSEKAVDLKAVVGNATSFTWDYGDGIIAAAPQPQVSYKYNSGGIYKPSITVKNSDGCATAASLNTTILIDTLNISLQPQPDKICDSAVVRFNPVVKSLGADQLGRSLQYSWNFGASGSGNTSTATDPSFKYNKPGNYTASLRVRSQAGCDKTANASIRVITTPTVSITAVEEICAKNTVSFNGNATPSAGVTWKWDFKNGQTSTSQTPDPVTYNNPGNYKITFTANNDGCIRDATPHSLDVRSLPVVHPMNDTTIVIGFTVPLKATGSSDIVKWSWSPASFLDCISCAAPVSLPRKHIRYEVTGYNQYGCSASASMGIRLVCAETPLFIPNTFTPNKDGRNDRFYPRGKGVTLVKFFRIYNRLGEMIFERRDFNLNDPAQGWDGTYLGKPLTSGVFTYASDMICDAGETFSLKGNIMLIR